MAIAKKLADPMNLSDPPQKLLQHHTNRFVVATQVVVALVLLIICSLSLLISWRIAHQFMQQSVFGTMAIQTCINFFAFTGVLIMLPADLAPAVFPKFGNGRWHPICVVLGAPYLAPFQLFHYFCKLRRSFRHHEVMPGLYLGRPPMFRLLPPCTDIVVDLAMELQADFNVVRHLDYISLPAMEDSVPVAQSLCSVLLYCHQALKGGKVVYVHCGEGGMSRSSLFVCGLLVLHAVRQVAESTNSEKVLQALEARLSGNQKPNTPPSIISSNGRQLDPVYGALCQPFSALQPLINRMDVSPDALSALLLEMISELAEAAEAHVVSCQAETGCVPPQKQGLHLLQRQFLKGAVWAVLLQPDTVVPLLPARLRMRGGMGLKGIMFTGWALSCLWASALVFFQVSSSAYHITGCVVFILYASPITTALALEYEWCELRSHRRINPKAAAVIEHPMLHPARQCFFYGLVCDAIFGYSLAFGPADDSAVGPHCQVHGLLTQLGITGSIASFGMLCVHMALQVWDPFKQGLGRERWFPVAWAVISLSVFFASPSIYGPSQVGFCWIAHRPLGLFSPQSLSLTYIPCMLTMFAAVLAMRWSRHNKINFPNWHRDIEAFRLSYCSAILFFAAWVPFLLCRFGWTLSPILFPELLTAEGSLRLHVAMASIIFGQAIMKALFWVKMMHTSTLPVPGTALTAFHLFHLLNQEPERVRRLWGILLANGLGKLSTTQLKALEGEVAAVCTGASVIRAAYRIARLLNECMTLEQLLDSVQPGDEEEILIPEPFRQEIMEFISSCVHAEVEDTVAEAAKESVWTGSPQLQADSDDIAYKLWGLSSVDSAISELTSAFQRVFWYRFLALARRDQASDPMFPVVRLVLWHQLVLIWRAMRTQRGTAKHRTVFQAFVEDFTRPLGEGYLGSMRRDYSTAVEHALFHISLRMPRACGLTLLPPNSQTIFQAVPGFPQATYTDYAPEIFTEIQALYHVAPRDYRHSICRLETIGHAGGSGVRMLITHDQRFIVKQITSQERNELLRILPRYFCHLKSSVQPGMPPSSLIAPIFGCHAIRMASKGASRTILLVVMANMDVFGQQANNGPLAPPLVKVDLKGSWVHREQWPGEFISAIIQYREGWNGDTSYFAKDVDLIKTSQCLSSSEWQDTFAMSPATTIQLRADAIFLAAEGLMDYSLLAIVFSRHPTAFAIVDYLQRWDTMKQWERVAKGCNCGVSATPPDYYANRFVRNLSRLLFYQKSFLTTCLAGAPLPPGDGLVPLDNSFGKSWKVDVTCPLLRDVEAQKPCH